jgi:hypothetical protein
MSSNNKSEIAEGIVWDENAPIVQDPNDDPAEFYIDRDKNSIEVKCRNCALWKHNLACFGDKPMCFPGRKLDDVLVNGVNISRRMNENLWSCRGYFIPQESAGLLSLLPETKEHTWAIRHITQVVKAMSRFNVEAHQRRLSPYVLDYAVAIASQHGTKTAMNYTLPFLQFVADEVQKQIKAADQKPKRSRAVRYCPGDNLEWTDLKTGQRLTGWFQCLGRKDSSVTLVSLQADAAAAAGFVSIPVKYSLTEWRNKGNPKLINKATLVDNSK